jgi:hypothetical protein
MGATTPETPRAWQDEGPGALLEVRRPTEAGGVPAAEAEPAGWAWLYRVGGIAAVITVLLILVAVLAHLLWPPPPWAPGAVGDWYAYLRANPLAGLLNLDLAMAVGLVLAVPLYLALYVALRHASPSGVLLATAAALLATLLHLLSNTAVELLAFSEAHAAAPTETQRAVYLAAGEAALSAYYGTVFQISYVLGYVAYVAIGAVMLRSRVFGSATAYLGILTGVAGFGFYLPTVGLLLSVLVVLLIGVWNVLVARRLFQLARGVPAAAASRHRTGGPW